MVQHPVFFLRSIFFIFLCFAGIGVGFQCPDKKYNLYEDPIQCDKYYECQDGRAKEKLCPDGLVFDPNNHRIINRCDQPFNVDCGDRQELRKFPHSQWCGHLTIKIQRTKRCFLSPTHLFA